VIGVDIAPQKHYCGDGFIQMDALEFLNRYIDGEFEQAQAMAASPPCQFASIMRNLPWLKGKEYPALIKPTRDRLMATGLPWVIENVYSARWGSRQLAKLALQEHGMQAGWLCGAMFGRPFYRHRLFESSFFWLQPGHTKHQHTIRDGRSLGGRARDIVFVNPPKRRGSWEKDYQEAHPDESRQAATFVDRNGRIQTPTPKASLHSLLTYQNGARARGCGIGHAAGVGLVRAAMEISWMTRDEITQAIPPCYTRYVGAYLLAVVGGRAIQSPDRVRRPYRLHE